MTHSYIWIVAAGLFLFIASCTEKPKKVHTDSTRPHFLIIMADDVGRECFSAYNASEFETPNISRLAASGKVFDYAYSQPLCTPSRVEMMTGKSNYFNYDYFEILPKGERTFAHFLKSMGYATCVGGKWQLTGVSILDSLKGTGMDPNEAGFDEYYLYQLHSKPKRYWGATYHFNGEEVNLWENQYGPEIIVDNLIDFMDRNADEPMFLYYPMILAHAPFKKTPLNASETGLSAKERYKGMVLYIDHLVGRLVDKLEDLGIRDNTFILFTTDNGSSKRFTSQFGDRKVVGGKGQTIDDGIHAPFIVDWGDTITHGKVDETMVSLYDIFPTMMDVLGQTPDDPQMGHSFLPFLLDRPDATGNEVHFGYFHPTRNVPREGEKEVIFVQGPRWKLYRDGRLIDKANDLTEIDPIMEEEDNDTSAAVRERLLHHMDSVLSMAK